MNFETNLIFKRESKNKENQHPYFFDGQTLTIYGNKIKKFQNEIEQFLLECIEFKMRKKVSNQNNSFDCHFNKIFLMQSVSKKSKNDKNKNNTLNEIKFFYCKSDRFKNKSITLWDAFKNEKIIINLFIKFNNTILNEIIDEYSRYKMHVEKKNISEDKKWKLSIKEKDKAMTPNAFAANIYLFAKIALDKKNKKREFKKYLITFILTSIVAIGSCVAGFCSAFCKK